MRTQFYVGLLGFVAGGLMGAAGCSDITAGQSSDPPGPPMLEHVAIQDSAWVGGTSVQRNTIVDLLDNTPGIPCSDTQPCLKQFLEGFHVPDFSCSCPTDAMTGSCMKGTSGTCNDPLKVTAAGVPIFANTGDPGDQGSGMQIRMVFSKLLNNSIESITMDNTQPPGSTNTYTLMPGIIEVDDPNGMAIPGLGQYDNGGTPGIGTNTPSDLLQVPLGPAIVFRPGPANLDPKTTYTIKLNTTNLKDRQGNPVADANGNPLPATYSIKFTTEDITRRSRASYPRSFPDATTMMPPVIKPDEVLNFGFWEAVDPATVMPAHGTWTGPAGFDPMKVEFFQNKAGPAGTDFSTTPPDPMACKMGSTSGATATLRVAYTDGAGNFVPWPAGAYTVTFTVQDRHHITKYDATKLMVSFTVAGSAGCPMVQSMSNPCADTHSNRYFLTPEQCTGM